MSWNYRVVRSSDVDPGGKPWVQYAIHEAYSDDSKTQVAGITELPSAVISETVEGMREVLRMMAEALDKPVLEEELTGDRRMR